MSLPPSYLDAKKFEPLSDPKLLLGFLAVEKSMPMIVESTKLEDTLQQLNPQIAGHFFVEAMCKRLAAMRPDMSFSPHTLVWCAAISDRIGGAIHWAYTMMDYERRHGRPMTVSDWCDSFPEGPPSEPEKQRLWDEQKIGGERGDGWSDNALDGREAWAMLHATFI